MIIYNMRYRGPYEYDKLVLNVFQFHNLVLKVKKAMEMGDGKLESYTEKIKQMNKSIAAVSDQIAMYKEEAETR